MPYVKPKRVEGEPYLFERKGPRGPTYSYVRAVPSAVQHLVGKTIWQISLGSDLANARRLATGWAAKHDELAKKTALDLAADTLVVTDKPTEPVVKHAYLDADGQVQPGSRPGAPIGDATPATAVDLEDLFVPLEEPALPPDLKSLDPVEAMAALVRYQAARRDWKAQEALRARMAPLTAALIATNGQALPGTRLLLVTLDDAIDEWFKARNHKNNSRNRMETVMRRVRESIGARTPLAQVTPDHINAFVFTMAKMPAQTAMPLHYRSKPMAFLADWFAQNKDKTNAKGEKPQAVTRATVAYHLRVASGFFGWAKWKYKLSTNPCEGAHHGLPKETRPPEDRHFPALDWKQAPAFVEELMPHIDGENEAARALLFKMMTVPRRSNILTMRWRDLDSGIWTIPASEMKTNTAFRVPLPRQAVELLGTPGNADELVFASINRYSMGNLRRDKMKKGAAFTEHGWRTAFVAFAGNHARASRDLAQLCIQHQVGTDTERAYMRDTWEEQRGELLQKWADYLLPPASP